MSPLPATWTWTVDPRHSRVGFRVKHHAVATFRSGFRDFEGRYDAAAGTLTRLATATGTVSGSSRVRRHDGAVNDPFGIDLELTIDRRDFGVDFNNELLYGRLNLGWDVTLELSLELSAPVEEGDAARVE